MQPTSHILWQLRLPSSASPMRRFVHGLVLPALVLGKVLADRGARRRYLRVTLTQAVVTLVLAVLFVPAFRALDRAEDEMERQAETALQQTLGVVEHGVAQAIERRTVERAATSTDQTPAQEPADDRQVLAMVLDESAAGFRSELDALKVLPKDLRVEAVPVGTLPAKTAKAASVPVPPPTPKTNATSQVAPAPTTRGSKPTAGSRSSKAVAAPSAPGPAAKLAAAPPVPPEPPAVIFVPVPHRGLSDAERERIRAQAREARERAQQAREEAREQEQALRERLQEEEQSAADAVEEAREAEQDAREQAEEARQEAREAEAELRDARNQDRAEARAEKAELKARMKEAFDQAEQLRQQVAAAESVRAQTEAIAAKAREEARQAVAAARQQLAQQLDKQQAEIDVGTAQLAREAAMRAVEGLRLPPPAAPAAPEAPNAPASDVVLGQLEAQVEALGDQLEQRADAADERDTVQEADIQAAMSIAMEASLLAERAREESRRLRDQLRSNSLSGDAREEAEANLQAADELASSARAVARDARQEAKQYLKAAASKQRVAHADSEVERGQERIAAAVEQLSPLQRLLVFLAALYTALYVVQFIVISLSRDYHDVIGRDASLLTGIAPEDPELRPRVRLDLRWLRTRMWRRWRALKLFALGVPVIWLVAWPLPEWVRNVLLSIWGSYWLAVFVAGKTARAWVDEGLAPEPWFLRAASKLSRKVPLLGKGPFRLYGRLWQSQGTEVFAPAECLERQPLEFAGLTVFRTLASLPLLKVFLRPLIPVAAAHLIESERVIHPPRAEKVAQALTHLGPPRPQVPASAVLH